VHDIRLLDLPIDVLARVGPLLRSAELVLARTAKLLSDRTQYLVVGVERGAVVAITVTRSTYGDVQREVERAEGSAATGLLQRLGLLQRDRGGRRPSAGTEENGALSN
jgi:hypothetical protein